MEVRNIKTEEVFFIRPDHADRIGKPINVPVYDHEPHGGGCRHTRIGSVDLWKCGRKESAPVKVFRGNYLTKVED